MIPVTPVTRLVDGKSLKNVQRKAAQRALKNTEYQHHSLKIKKSEKLETPEALLNNLVLKEQIEGKTALPDISVKKSYLHKLNDTV
ncbi:hypothetical protein GWI33_015619 [Rhynchophorus ferrugineus]|uniref:Uncharacterized protein n=1 Tax=Rhynchophorus ferrugineus TaxID=354439 RepID=A0A834HZG0_RHYFE|nr:hypothetical protein GWI33_015619 [Rhynchophorus ferrugineus]